MQAKKKELRKANGKLATQTRCMTAKTNLSQKQKQISTYFPPLAKAKADQHKLQVIPMDEFTDQTL